MSFRHESSLFNFPLVCCVVKLLILMLDWTENQLILLFIVLVDHGHRSSERPFHLSFNWPLLAFSLSGCLFAKRVIVRLVHYSTSNFAAFQACKLNCRGVLAHIKTYNFLWDWFLLVRFECLAHGRFLTEFSLLRRKRCSQKGFSKRVLFFLSFH